MCRTVGNKQLQRVIKCVMQAQPLPQPPALCHTMCRAISMQLSKLFQCVMQAAPTNALCHTIPRRVAKRNESPRKNLQVHDTLSVLAVSGKLSARSAMAEAFAPMAYRGSGACVLNAVVGPPDVNMGHNEASACVAKEQEYASMGRSGVAALIVKKKSRMHNNNKNNNPQTLSNYVTPQPQGTVSHLNLRALWHTSTSEHYVTPQPQSTTSHLNLRTLCHEYHTSTSEHYVIPQPQSTMSHLYLVKRRTPLISCTTF